MCNISLLLFFCVGFYCQHTITESFAIFLDVKIKRTVFENASPCKIFPESLDFCLVDVFSQPPRPLLGFKLGHGKSMIMFEIIVLLEDPTMTRFITFWQRQTDFHCKSPSTPKEPLCLWGKSLKCLL